MSDSIWKTMVEVQQARRRTETEGLRVDISRPVPRRRKRPSTLRSIRNLLVPDHYTILAAGDY